MTDQDALARRKRELYREISGYDDILKIYFTKTGEVEKQIRKCKIQIDQIEDEEDAMLEIFDSEIEEIEEGEANK